MKDSNKDNKKRFKKKWKKQSKVARTFFIVIGLFYLVNLILFTYLTKFFMTKNLMSLLLEAVGTYLKIKNLNLAFTIILIFLIIYFFIYLLFGIVHMFTKHRVRFVLLLIFACLFSGIMTFGSYNIYAVYTRIDKTQKKYVTYSSVMLTMNDTDKYDTIGMINSKNDPTGYIVPQEMIKKYNIKGKIKKYDDYISMVSDLYEGKVDAIFVSSDYVTLFGNYDNFADIASRTKVVHKLEKKMENVDNVTYSTKSIDEPFTILLMGIDGTGNGISKSGSFNGDTLMLISFDPKTLSATVFSIPRDTYVPIACRSNKENKINSAAYGGTSCVVKTIENLTDIKIDYYAKINFTGVVNLVNDLDGITVDVPMKFCEQDSQRRFGEYELCLDKGVQKLNGEQALALARHRHSLPLGDFQRVQNQQLVVEAMVEKLKTVKSVDAFYKILNDVSNNIDTNMSTSQILGLFSVLKDTLANKIHDSSQISIQKTWLSGYDLTMYIPGMGNVYTFQYYKESLDAITDAMKITLGLKKPKLTKTFSFSANTTYEPVVIGKNIVGKKENKNETVPNFVGRNISYLRSWAGYRNIRVSVIEVTKGDYRFDSSKPDGYILSQSVSSGTKTSNVSSITATIIRKSSYDAIESTGKSSYEPESTAKSNTGTSTSGTTNSGKTTPSQDNNSDTPKTPDEPVNPPTPSKPDASGTGETGDQTGGETGGTGTGETGTNTTE